MYVHGIVHGQIKLIVQLQIIITKQLIHIKIITGQLIQIQVIQMREYTTQPQQHIKYIIQIKQEQGREQTIIIK